MNSYEENAYAEYLQHDVDMKNNVHEDVLKMWQKSSTESVLFYDGRSVLSARLSPKQFLRQGLRTPADMPETDSMYGRSLEDVRQVDVHDTGRAFTADDGRWAGNITCMCQHRIEKQTFATCDA
jgi:hypothetical protein